MQLSGRKEEPKKKGKTEGEKQKRDDDPGKSVKSRKGYSRRVTVT